MHPELVVAEPVIQEVEALILDEEGVTAGAAALGQQHPLCTALRDHHIGRDAPGPVVQLGCGGEGDRRPTGVEDVLVPRLGNRRAFHGEAGAHSPSIGSTWYLPASAHQRPIISISLSR